jgi:putative SOS response-associated peptidase YedK
MALAGPWRAGVRRAARVVRTFAIITCEANEKLRALHDRTPTILPRAAWPAWLAAGQRELVFPTAP